MLFHPAETLRRYQALTLLPFVDIKNGGNWKLVSVSYYFPGYVFVGALLQHTVGSQMAVLSWWRDREKPETVGSSIGTQCIKHQVGLCSNKQKTYSHLIFWYRTLSLQSGFSPINSLNVKTTLRDRQSYIIVF